MICPKCDAEYRAGFTQCADCLVPLVHELPAKPVSKPKRTSLRTDALELTTVFATNSLASMAVAKSILDSVGLMYAVRGEYEPEGAGWRGSPFDVGLEIQVAAGDADEARALLSNVTA